jgi:hypothetical protein
MLTDRNLTKNYLKIILSGPEMKNATKRALAETG